MDESDGLENRYGGNLIMGSNPIPSARLGANMALVFRTRPFFFWRFPVVLPHKIHTTAD